MKPGTRAAFARVKAFAKSSACCSKPPFGSAHVPAPGSRTRRKSSNCVQRSRLFIFDFSQNWYRPAVRCRFTKVKVRQAYAVVRKAPNGTSAFASGPIMTSSCSPPSPPRGAARKLST